ncbi:MAG: hypothetical protein RBG13Loki_1156 [Promethearchaeota archaeon CR_4]|nr:MAG: hypothetical protein RBG13Loki_1156 [Candidatus Lokiarchaeota archaeon CR_4]
MHQVPYDVIPIPKKVCGKCPCFQGPDGNTFCKLSGKRVHYNTPACQIGGGEL